MRGAGLRYLYGMNVVDIMAQKPALCGQKRLKPRHIAVQGLWIPLLHVAGRRFIGDALG